MTNELLWGRDRFVKYDTIEDCWRCLVVKFIVSSAISDTWDLRMGIRNPVRNSFFLGNTVWDCQPSPMLYSKLFFFFSFTFFLLILLPYQVRWFYHPQFLQKTPPDFPWNVINTSAGEVSNNKVSHLVRFILGFGTENSVPLSEVSHILSVPLNEVFITIKW